MIIGRDLIHQCSWCGLVQNGPLAGTVALKQNGEGSFVPDLSAGESHGCCPTCRKRFFPKKAGVLQQHATQLVLTASPS